MQFFWTGFPEPKPTGAATTGEKVFTQSAGQFLRRQYMRGATAAVCCSRTQQQSRLAHLVFAAAELTSLLLFELDFPASLHTTGEGLFVVSYKVNNKMKIKLFWGI